MDDWAYEYILLKGAQVADLPEILLSLISRSRSVICFHGSHDDSTQPLNLLCSVYRH